MLYYVHSHAVNVIASNEKEAMNLKENKRSGWKGLEGKKGRENDAIITSEKEK